MENNDKELIIQEYRNMHAQLEGINEELPKIREYAENNEKMFIRYSEETKKLKEELTKQIDVFKEKQKKADKLIKSLQQKDEKITNLIERLTILENKIGIKYELNNNNKSEKSNDSIIERLEALELEKIEIDYHKINNDAKLENFE